MTLDMRARRAGDAVRASVREVNPMTELLELQRESDLRGRARSAVVMATAAVLVVTAAWLVAVQPWKGAGVGPASPQPTVSTSPAAPVIVGSKLRPALTATVPPDWFVVCDCSYVEMAGFDTPVITVSPLTQVFDPATGRGTAAPADYVGWLRAHPWLTLVSQRTVSVDGIEAPQLTLSVRQSATSTDPAQPFLRFASVAGPEVVQPYALQSPGDVFTETVLTLHGKRLLVRAFGGTTATPQDVETVQKALSGFLASIRT